MKVYWNVLYSTVTPLYSTLLYSILLYYTILYCTVLHCKNYTSGVVTYIVDYSNQYDETVCKQSNGNVILRSSKYNDIVT